MEAVVQRQIQHVMAHAGFKRHQSALPQHASAFRPHLGQKVTNRNRPMLRFLKKLHSALTAGREMRHILAVAQFPENGKK